MATIAWGSAACSSDPASNADAGSSPRATGDDVSSPAPASCSAPDDCVTTATLGDGLCCFHGACLYGDAVYALTCAGAASQVIATSSYDQTCQVDADCVEVAEGDFCQPGGAFNCPSAAIAKRAQPQYLADVSKTNAAGCLTLSGCPDVPGAACVAGRCQVRVRTEALLEDAAGEAGGDAARE